MFKFLKELRDSIKEGVAEGRAEGRAEAAEERAAAAEADAGLGAGAGSGTETAPAEGMTLDEVPTAERFGVAVGAPYRDVFLGVLRLHPEDRPATRLQTLGLSEDQVAVFTKLMKRDFGVTDGASLRAAVTEMLAAVGGDSGRQAGADEADAGGPENRDALALLLVQLSHLIAGGGGVGWLEYDEALTLMAPVSARAREAFTGWEDLGAAFLAGERAGPSSNVLGRKVLSVTVRKLGEHPASPWRTVPWEDAAAGA